MSESIELPITYKGETIIIKAELRLYGYTYKLSVDIEGTEVLFEKDDQQNYRAILASPGSDSKVNVELVNAILNTLSQLE